MFLKPCSIHWMTALTNTMQQMYGDTLGAETLETALDFFGRDMHEEFFDDESRWCDYYYDFLITYEMEDGEEGIDGWDFDAALTTWCDDHPDELHKWAETCFSE